MVEWVLRENEANAIQSNYSFRVSSYPILDFHCRRWGKEFGDGRASIGASFQFPIATITSSRWDFLDFMWTNELGSIGKKVMAKMEKEEVL